MKYTIGVDFGTLSARGVLASVEDGAVDVLVRQVGPGPAPEYWRERLAAWKDYVEGLPPASSSVSSVQP